MRAEGNSCKQLCVSERFLQMLGRELIGELIVLAAWSRGDGDFGEWAGGRRKWTNLGDL